MIRVIKRDGTETNFNKSNIVICMQKANADVEANGQEGMSEDCIQTIATRLYNRCFARKRAVEVEEIQDMIETELMKEKCYNVAKQYIRYRHKRELARKMNTTDDQVMTLISCNNEEVKQENSNKNPTLIPTQRDYIAGIVSKDITNRILLPQEIVDAHNNGIIHYHDADYNIQPAFNCDLINLEDMLQNGTVISDTMIEKPHSFATACTITTQIIAQVASNQYGGQSVTLSHLAPFVDVSRQKIKKEVQEELADVNISANNSTFKTKEEYIDYVTEKRLRKEIEKGVQTIQYQIVTLLTTNGQSPFVTLFMYLNEVKDNRTKQDLALIIEEVIKQRYKGVKNEKGVYITPAFPKLIYVLEEDNIQEGTPYYYLTKLAAKCTAKRLVPDYISEKKMKELKENQCYPCMGCLDYNETIELDTGVFKIGEVAKALECLLSKKLCIPRSSKSLTCLIVNCLTQDKFKIQYDDCDFIIELAKHKDDIVSVDILDLQSNNRRTLFKDITILSNTVVTETSRSTLFKFPKGIKIKSNNEFVDLQAVLFNNNVTDWIKLTYEYNSEFKTVLLTTDHPLPIKDKGVIQASDLVVGDCLYKVNITDNNANKFATITNIEYIERNTRSYDVTTENHYFDINQDILSHNCRSFLSPWKDENGNYKFYGRLTA